MKSETWTTERGNKVEMTWEVAHNDINVWTKIEVSVNGKKYTSDGQTENGALVVKQIGISANLMKVPSEIIDAIKNAQQSAKAEIAKNVADHNEYINRMSEIGY